MLHFKKMVRYIIMETITNQYVAQLPQFLLYQMDKSGIFK